ncbi:MAG: type II toxin-antitoxin system HicB family antitoxin [Thermodesulfobacteriota bacterium]
MKNSLRYKGYLGVFEYDPDDRAFHGHVVGLRDMIHFTGRSVKELEQSLAGSVEDYLTFCAERNKTPERPYSGQFRLRLDPEDHRLIAQAAEARGQSLNAFVADAARRAAREEAR